MFNYILNTTLKCNNGGDVLLSDCQFYNMGLQWAEQIDLNFQLCVVGLISLMEYLTDRRARQLREETRPLEKRNGEV